MPQQSIGSYWPIRNRGTNVQGDNCPGGTVVLGGHLSWGDTCPGGQLSRGTTVQGDKCQGDKCRGDTCRGDKCHTTDVNTPIFSFCVSFNHKNNTSLAAPGALAHCLQRRTACKIQNGRQGPPIWPTVSGKGSNPR